MDYGSLPDSVVTWTIRATRGPRSEVDDDSLHEEAHARHRTILEFAPRSTPALAYDRLTEEILGHGEAGHDE